MSHRVDVKLWWFSGLDECKASHLGLTSFMLFREYRPRIMDAHELTEQKLVGTTDTSQHRAPSCLICVFVTLCQSSTINNSWVVSYVHLAL